MADLYALDLELFSLEKTSTFFQREDRQSTTVYSVPMPMLLVRKHMSFDCSLEPGDLPKSLWALDWKCRRICCLYVLQKQASDKKG